MIPLVKIKKAFPALPGSFYEVLCEMLVARKFTDERLTKAIEHVIATCKYPTPTIAHFISFDENASCAIGHEFAVDFDKYSSCKNVCRDKDYEACKIANLKLLNEGR
jgi:hypothetical protein